MFAQMNKKEVIDGYWHAINTLNSQDDSQLQLKKQELFT